MGIILADVRKTLSNGLLGMARLGEFEETQDEGDRFVFVADIELLPSIDYHGVVVAEPLAEEPEQEPVQNRKIMPPAEAPNTVQPTMPKKPAEAQVSKTVKPPAKTPKAAAQPMISDQPLEIMTAEKAVVLLETVDGKMLRQSLDMMNLRRSSNIRLALTRIFRSATDSEALISAIMEEAGKITLSEDLQELEMIRVISVAGFLQPVVELLCQEVFQEK
jgi:hypothetical protein